MTHREFLRQHNKLGRPTSGPISNVSKVNQHASARQWHPLNTHITANHIFLITQLPQALKKCPFTRMLYIFLPHIRPYPWSDRVFPGHIPKPRPEHTAIRAGEPQFQLSPIGSGQKLKPETVWFWQAVIYPSQPSPGTSSRWWRWREKAATLSIHIHILQVRVVRKWNWLTAKRKPIPLG